MPVWLANDAPTTSSSVRLVHQPGRHRRARAAQHPRAERVGVGYQALGPERGEHRGAEPLGEPAHRVRRPACALPDDDHRTAGGAEPGQGGVERRGCDAQVGPPSRGERGGRVRREVLHLVGKHEVGDAAPVQRVLDGGRGELGVVGARVHGHRGQRDVAEDGREVEVLERAAAQHLRRHLPGDRDHRRAVELGVVQPGEQVGRAGPGDREAGRGAPGELAVGRGGERGGALVPNADVAQLAAGFGAPQRLGEPQVGVPDHAEDRVDPPRDERLHQHVGHRSRAVGDRGQLDVGAVGALLDRVRRGRVGEARGRAPGGRAVVVAVPRAAQPAVLDRALAERAALVRAVVVQRADAPAAAGEGHRAAVHDRGADPALVGDLIEAVPGAGHRATPA